MKTLIAYTSETGVTRACADILSREMPGSTVVDLKKEKPDPTPYDIVVVGTHIRMGAVNRHAAEYLENCASILEKKRLGIFLCCADETKLHDYLVSQLPESICSHAVTECFGGSLNPDGAKGLDRLMIKLMLKAQKKSGESIAFHPERIPAFAAKLIDTNCAN